MRKNPNSLIRQAIELTLARPSQGPTYFIRPAGSYVQGFSRDKTDAAGGEEIAAWLQTLTWREVTEDVRALGAGFGQVRYFQAAPDRPAFEGVRLWGELTPAERQKVRVAESFHRARDGSIRYELVSELAPKATDVISIAVGNANNPFEPATPENAVVYTWFPGRITPMVEIQPDSLSSNLSPYATVKAEGPKANPRGARRRLPARRNPEAEAAGPRALLASQRLLAQLTALRDAAKHKHWATRRYELHLVLDKIHDIAAEQLDEFAEAAFASFTEGEINIPAVCELASADLVSARSPDGLGNLVDAALESASAVEELTRNGDFGLSQAAANVAVALQKVEYFLRTVRA